MASYNFENYSAGDGEQTVPPSIDQLVAFARAHSLTLSHGCDGSGRPAKQVNDAPVVRIADDGTVRVFRFASPS